VFLNFKITKEIKMKKLLLAALAVTALSTAALASNDNSQTYGSTPDLVLPSNNATSPTSKKKIYYGESNSTINSVGETGNVSEQDRILEKGGDSHDVPTF
jgi:hypothetical protein